MWHYMRDQEQIKLSINVHKEKKSGKDLFRWDFIHNILYICRNIEVGVCYHKMKVLKEIVSNCLINTNVMDNISHHNMFDCAHMHESISLGSSKQSYEPHSRQSLAL